MSDDSRASTVNMKCNQECWMLCDDRLNTGVSSDGQRTTLLGYFSSIFNSLYQDVEIAE